MNHNKSQLKSYNFQNMLQDCILRTVRHEINFQTNFQYSKHVKNTHEKASLRMHNCLPFNSY